MSASIFFGGVQGYRAVRQGLRVQVLSLRAYDVGFGSEGSSGVGFWLGIQGLLGLCRQTTV